MKILVYFSGQLFEPKGTPIRTRNQIRQLTEHGFDVYYAGKDSPEDLPSGAVYGLTNPILRFAQLTQIVRKEKIDCVYIQTSAGIWYAPWLRLTTRAKIGIDFHSRRFQEDHITRGRHKMVTAFLEFVELQLVRFLHFGTVVSPNLYTYYSPFVSSVLLLPVGVDTKAFSPSVIPDATIKDWKGGATLIGYAGNLKWYQGVETLLEAFSVLPTKSTFKLLLIASSGAEELRAYLKEQKLEQSVLLLERQPHTQIPSLLAATDGLVVVRPSNLVTEYAFPSKLVEYAALGKALILSEVGGVEKYFTHQINALVIPPSDVSALVRSLQSLKEATLRERIGSKARVLALEEFDLKKLGGKLSDFLVSL